MNNTIRELPVDARLSRGFWIVEILGFVVTFLMFMYLDPEPNLILAIFVSLNVVLLVWATLKLYEQEMLLSPMSTTVIGPSMFIYYTFGNLGARITGEGRYGSNPGSLDYYPLAAILSFIGLVIFCLIIFGIFKNFFKSPKYRYQDLTWKPWQVVTSSLITISILLYLAGKYEFINGYFWGVENTVDRWLISAYYFFIVFQMLVGISVFSKSHKLNGKLLGTIGILFPLIYAVGIRSRTFMIGLIILAALAWITLEPRKARSISVLAVIVSGLAFIYGTVVKHASVYGDTTSIAENLSVVFNIDRADVIEQNEASAELDFQYRVAGFELPAALIMSLDRGTPPMEGKGILGGLLSSLPSFLRPEGLYSERLEIQRHFVGRYIYYSDSIGLPLSSGLADIGILFGPIIYLFIAVFCLIIWKISQISLRLYLAFLVVWVRVDPMDLFWEDGLLTIRLVIFVWICFMLLSKLIMPVSDGTPAIAGDSKLTGSNPSYAIVRRR